MNNVIYLRGDAQRARHHVNDFFAKHGQGRPISNNDVDGHLSVVTVNGELVGAAYAAAAMSIADTLMVGGHGLDGIRVARRVHALEALVIAPDHRGQHYGTHLLGSVAGHAHRDFGADNLVTRVDDESPMALAWFVARGFTVLAPDEVLTLDGVPLPGADGHSDAYLRLGRTTSNFTKSMARVRQ